MPVVVTVKTDWLRVVTDITNTGIPLQELATGLDVSKSALIGWKQGSSPNHHTGEALITFWCEVTHRHRSELPVQVIRRRFVRSGARNFWPKEPTIPR
ncbi:TPA: hypothetical protein ACNVSH_004109 [Klebsiella aerogenes]|uniref:hypothetical protein n=1 Tax=Klebsiella aerogenes TaxID=548 RepID=UPI0004A074A6|nr:hypothetical protein [Klebsiella aerogenes]EKU4983178.1 hypothetical protein [Klebsiella aerogenes]EKZ6360727.1 hypothetical protein [Klebsiella aerogenes]KDF32830.1 hypothetical protein AE04_02321 [Klebsiella aerogenes MGH 78]MDX7654531.1 hypothetical protein [Klebsiella aerogenes]HBV3142605.1 hypothetical protein [Klebsiella aerogenes]